MATGTRYAGKVVVVTGGARGIGAGIVRAFVDSGAQVVVCDKDESGGRALERELPGAVFILCDVTREDDVRTLVSETIRRFGRLDCVVNNAGHHPPFQQRPEETSTEEFRQLLELNVLGMYTLTKLALPHLRKSQGNIINISSLVGAIGQAQAVPYVASKGAVTAMTKALALDESPYGVRVNCISPGNIWTPLWEELAASTPDPRATILEGTLAQPLGRMGQPAEVGAAAVFLASEANFCTGIELFVTGGAELGFGRKARRGTPVDAPDIPS
ncbi:L-fucose dehydrogenase [Callithrix jacchus]